MSSNKTLVLIVVLFSLILSLILGYHTYQNKLNREAYYECLRVVETISENDNRNGSGVRIVSMPQCKL